MTKEIERLRKAQANLVMPLIGPLLDAFDQLPNDVALMDELEGLSLDEIVAAMEIAANHINLQTEALGNCLMMAMRRSRADPMEAIHWQHIIRFCKEAGVEPSPLRSET